MTNGEYTGLVDFLGKQFAVIDRRFVAIETGIADLRRDMLAHFDELYGRLERLEQEHQAILQALRRIEALLGNEQTRREILEASVNEMKRQVAYLQARLEEIERRLAD